MQLNTSQFRKSCIDPNHPQHAAAIAPDPDRRMKVTAFDTSHVTLAYGCANEGEEEKERKKNKRRLHTATVSKHLADTPIHPLINSKPPEVHKSEESLSRKIRRTLAQLRAVKSPILKDYLHHIGAEEDPNCPLCGQERHTTAHLFRCTRIPTDLAPIDLWRRPVLVAELLEEWQTALDAAEEA